VNKAETLNMDIALQITQISQM